MRRFPLLTGTIGPDVIDIRKLYGETGLFTYDPGFTSTAACRSKITYIDGDEGILLHRGYRIEDLAEQQQLPGDGVPDPLRRAAERRGVRELHQWCDLPHHDPRPDQLSVPRLSP